MSFLQEQERKIVRTKELKREAEKEIEKERQRTRKTNSIYTRGFRGWVGIPGAMGGGFFFTLEKSKFSRFFKLENFQKVKKATKKL